MEYLSSAEETPWTPDLEYYCNVIGRLVDSILLMLNCFSFSNSVSLTGDLHNYNLIYLAIFSSRSVVQC